MKGKYFPNKYPQKKSECAFCKVEIDNLLENSEYDSDQAELIKQNFCNNCLFKSECDKIKENIKNANFKIEGQKRS